jgi:hypothetical protein
MSPPVRKGDGTGVVPQDIAEVRTGDGRVLFGGAIPDSDLYYKIDEGSGDVLTDSQGENDGTSVGSLVWVEDSAVDNDWYVELDDTNYVELSSQGILSIGSDFTVALELDVETAFSNDSTLVHWDAGNDADALTIGYRNGSLGARVVNGTNSFGVSHSEPSAPYNVDLVATWDASAESLELYLDETASTGTEAIGINITSTTAFWVGKEQGRTRDFAGRGAARFAVWETQAVDPSEFTL